MPLFEVKGWEVPSQAAATLSSSQPSRKRKRPVKDAGRVQSVQVNIEKLMRKVERNSLESRSEQKTKHKNIQRIQSAPRNQESKPQKEKKVSPQDLRLCSKEHRDESISLPPSKRTKQKISAASLIKPDALLPRCEKNVTKVTKPSVGLTNLQSNMKNSLVGARFRWINEVLYTTDSAEGHRLMQDDPELYEEYHTGFRQQVLSWPSNPVNHYISVLSSYPRGTVIVDLGCGDAALARALVSKGYCVLSFDLVSDGVHVLEANVCERIPLPGTEVEDDNAGQVVDVCVCALSLMSHDWIGCIRETWRVLRLGGELKIAEVTSRFTNSDQFIAIITDLGFKLKHTDDSNTHFTLFEFRKIARAPLDANRWDTLRAQHTVLKPCEYKRR